MHREPLLDTADFERFINTVDPLLTPGRDVAWILAGRTESSLPRIKKVFAKLKMFVEAFYFCYSTKHMAQLGYRQKQRGIANLKSIEPALFFFLQGQAAQVHP